MRRKIGLTTEQSADAELIEGLLTAMHQGNADFTLAFRNLATALRGNAVPLQSLFSELSAINIWLESWACATGGRTYRSRGARGCQWIGSIRSSFRAITRSKKPCQPQSISKTWAPFEALLRRCEPSRLKSLKITMATRIRPPEQPCPIRPFAVPESVSVPGSPECLETDCEFGA